MVSITKKGSLVFFGVLMAILFVAMPRAYAIALYTDRSSWEAAVGSFTDVDIAGQVAEFASIPNGSFFNLPYNETLTNAGETLEGAQVPTSWDTWSGGNFPRVFWTLDATSASGAFNDAVQAFGLEMEPDSFDTHTMTLTLSDKSVLSQDVTGDSGAKFFGWTGGSITNMTLSSDVDFAFGRMVKGAQSVVPEPASMSLLGLGLVGLVGRRKRG